MKSDARPPNQCLRLSSDLIGLKEFPRSFFRRNTVHVARALIGTWFARRHDDLWFGARIVETEAYLGATDPAAHSRGGRRTTRIEPMYMDGGHLYVFLVYGMHCCANVVTRGSGIAEAVLLRAAEGPPGTPLKLLSGPGRLCSHLGITTTHSGVDLLAGGDLRLLQDSSVRPAIVATPRIGVDYAGEAKHWSLRFFDRNSPAVSGTSRLNAAGQSIASEQERDSPERPWTD
jgi:DNA-3-methyladenine glycosylase